MKPLEAINDCITWALLRNGYSTRGRDLDNVSESAWKRLKPGALVESMPENVRESLKQLKAHHFDAMPMDKWRFMDDAYRRKKRLTWVYPTFLVNNIAQLSKGFRGEYTSTILPCYTRKAGQSQIGRLCFAESLETQKTFFKGSETLDSRQGRTLRQCIAKQRFFNLTTFTGGHHLSPRLGAHLAIRKFC